jgi:hypothetical protein
MMGDPKSEIRNPIAASVKVRRALRGAPLQHPIGRASHVLPHPSGAQRSARPATLGLLVP